MSHVSRCKMTLHGKTAVPGTGEDNPLTRLTFGAVYSADPSSEDAIYGKYTPYGALDVNVATDRTEHFEVGKAYYLDISPAD